MGNCLFGGLGDEGDAIKVIKSDGGVLEFYGTVTAGNIADEFPGHTIFSANDDQTLLSHDHDLVPGQSYYLIPIVTDNDKSYHVRSNSESTPYRMSLDLTRALKRSYTDMLSRNHYGALLQRERKKTKKKKKKKKRGGICGSSCGVWKVKLVIEPQQLLRILSQDAATHDLIESLRAVANCPNAASVSSSSCSSSDHLSLSSSLNSTSKKNFFLFDV